MNSPFLHRVRTTDDFSDRSGFPFELPILRGGLDLELKSPVTFLAGANGSGKSTLLEGSADLRGFNLAGGNRDHRFDFADTHSELSPFLKLSWLPTVARGFFIRAETYFNLANYLDGMGGWGLNWTNRGLRCTTNRTAKASCPCSKSALIVASISWMNRNRRSPPSVS